MKSKKFGFLKHYRKIRVEGTNLISLINKCIKNEIDLRNLRWKNNIESTVEIKGEDFTSFKKLAGHSSRISVVQEGGAVPFFRCVRENIPAVAGAFLLGALIFYQSLFVAEIRIDGYSTIDEESLRQTLADAGLYEGARKSDDYSDVKAALYENHRSISWVSVYEKGRLIDISIAEADNDEKKEPSDTKPADIVASRSGMIEKIIPLKGNARVAKGDYVNKGDILITGKYKYQSTDYSRGDDFFYLYSHAEGQALAKVPERITYYFQKKQRVLKPTGRFIPGFYIRTGDAEIDTADAMCTYEVSERSESILVDIVKPLPVCIKLVRINEVKIEEEPQDIGNLGKVIDAALRQYAKDNLNKEERILDSSVDYSESEGLIKADVMLEVLEDIGTEKYIKIVKKSENVQEKPEE